MTHQAWDLQISAEQHCDGACCEMKCSRMRSLAEFHWRLVAPDRETESLQKIHFRALARSSQFLVQTTSADVQLSPVRLNCCTTKPLRCAAIKTALKKLSAFARGLYQGLTRCWRSWRRGARIARMMPGARGNGCCGSSACRSDQGRLPAL